MKSIVVTGASTGIGWRRLSRRKIRLTVLDDGN